MRFTLSVFAMLTCLGAVPATASSAVARALDACLAGEEMNKIISYVDEMELFATEMTNRRASEFSSLVNKITSFMVTAQMVEGSVLLDPAAQQEWAVRFTDAGLNGAWHMFSGNAAQWHEGKFAALGIPGQIILIYETSWGPSQMRCIVMQTGEFGPVILPLGASRVGSVETPQGISLRYEVANRKAVIRVTIPTPFHANAFKMFDMPLQSLVQVIVPQGE